MESEYLPQWESNWFMVLFMTTFLFQSDFNACSCISASTKPAIFEFVVMRNLTAKIALTKVCKRCLENSYRIWISVWRMDQQICMIQLILCDQVAINSNWFSPLCCSTHYRSFSVTLFQSNFSVWCLWMLAFIWSINSLEWKKE